MKNILIIGGSSGLGLQLTQDFLDAGNNVQSTYFKNQPDIALNTYPASQLPHQTVPGSLKIIPFNLQHPADLKIEHTVLDTLILNAAVIHNELMIKEKVETFQSILNQNLTANQIIIKNAILNLKKSCNPHIVIISSFSGFHGNMGQVSYSASKSALVGLGKSLAQELGEWNIKINIIFPGFMDSNQTKKLSQENIDKFKTANALKRFNTLTEISSFIVFLSNTENISGQIFNLDSRIMK